jgi:hypothetical protein
LVLAAPERLIMDLEYLYQDAVFVAECGEYSPGSNVYRAARIVLNECGLKHCCDCDEIKNLDNFYPSSNKNSPDGLTPQCKTCNTLRVQQWRDENRDKLNESVRRRNRAMMDNLPETKQRQQTLYRLFDEDDRLLYVGITWNVRNRFYAHKADKVWWDDVVRHELEEYPDRDSVLKAEMLAIKTELPIYNVVHA